MPGVIKALIFLLALAVAALPAACRSEGNPTQLEVHFVDVGQGDGILVRVPGGGDIAIDGGGRDSGFADYLRKQRVRSLAVVVATNPDADHIGGLIRALDRIKVREVWLSGQPHTTKTYEDFLEAIERSGATTKAVRRGAQVALGNANLTILHPVEPFFAGRNNNSVVVRLEYGAVSFLFAGDAERLAEESMLSAGLPLAASVLKMGHHGSRTSSTRRFIEAVSPRYAVYQAGRGNPFGHPHPEAVASVESVGAVVLGTDTKGTIVMRSDGASLVVETRR